MKRRDEWGWLTYPFWAAIARCLPLTWLYDHFPLVFFYIVSKRYGEGERWDMAHMTPAPATKDKR